MPKVSILMPACNVENFLRECMDSVVNQTLKDIEIICLDDGSKDSTGNILDEYAAKDSRVKVIHKPNSGYGHSMNVGLDHATGEYIGIIETDDFADTEMFEKLYITAKENNADMIKSNYYKYKSKPEPRSTFLEVLKPYERLYGKAFCPADEMEVSCSSLHLDRNLQKRDAYRTEHSVYRDAGGFLSGYIIRIQGLGKCQKSSNRKRCLSSLSRR